MLNDFFFQCKIVEAKDLAKNIYFQLTPKLDQHSEGIFDIMNAAIDTKSVQLDSSFIKQLPIANLSFSLKFLAQIKKTL